MGVLDNFFKGSSNGNELTVNTSVSLYEGGSSDTVNVSDSSSSITEDQAMGIASLYQGITVIADTIASMPVYLFSIEDGYQKLMEDDNRNAIMSGMANEVLTSYNIKRAIVKDLILYGNAYVEILREGETVSGLYYFPVDSVTAKADNNGYYFETKQISTGVDGEVIEPKIVDYYDMLLLIRNNKYNSVKGSGILEIGAQTLSLAVEESTYLNNLFRNGLSSRAILNSKTPLRKEIKQKLKQDLKNLYTGSKNAGSVLVLEGDMSLVPLSLSPNDIKLIEQKVFTISEVARFLNIPKHMLNLDRGQGMYSNITQERLSLMQNTLTPYMVAIEESLNQKLLTEEERIRGMYFKFDTSEILRLTPQDQANYNLSLYEKGIITLEEVRKALALGADAETIAELKKIDEVKEKVIDEQINGTGETEKEDTKEDTKEDVNKKKAKKDNIDDKENK